MTMRPQNSCNRQVMRGCNCDSKLCHFMLTFVFLTDLYCVSKVIQFILSMYLIPAEVVDEDHADEDNQ